MIDGQGGAFQPAGLAALRLISADILQGVQGRYGRKRPVFGLSEGGAKYSSCKITPTFILLTIDWPGSICMYFQANLIVAVLCYFSWESELTIVKKPWINACGI